MNPSFGFTLDLYCFIKFSAFSRLSPFSFIRYAIIIEALLETPCQQWTKTIPSLSIAAFIYSMHSLKYLEMSSVGMSYIEITLYTKFLGNGGSIPSKT